MTNLLLNAIFPHPPIIIPEIGKSNLAVAEKTYQGAKKLAEEVVTAQPETLVLITPHGPTFQDALILWEMEQLEGDLTAFGAPQIKISLANDLVLLDRIVAAASEMNIPAVKFGTELAKGYGLDPSLDHGCLVPLYYLQQAGFQGRIVVISIGLLPFPELYAFGKAVQKAINIVGRRTAVLTSGDLSHCLTPDAPAGFHPEAKILDEKIVEAVKNGRVEDLIYLDRTLIEKGGECALRPIIIGLGTMDGWETINQIISYEGPFGVGYMNALIKPHVQREERNLVNKFFARRGQEIEEKRKKESPLVRLARQTVESYAKEKRLPKLELDLPAELSSQGGAFVSIKKHGQLRGCIGTTAATRPTLKEEIIHNALKAAFKDPRFEPVAVEELEDLVYSVDVLGEPEAVCSISELDPKRYGVIVRKGRCSGLLLPDLEGIDTVEEQVRIAKQKAGISPQEETSLFRFEVKRHK